MPSDWVKVPNLLSLGRLIMLAPTGYFLSRPEPSAQYYALLCLSLAAITDYFDGYFARKLHQETELGLILDPLSDKILAGALAILLIIYRAFPLWLAGVIVGRDLMIALGGLVLRKRTNVIAPSNLTGKYSFAALALLLVSYVIRFEFGIALMTAVTLPLLALSLWLYGHGLTSAMKSGVLPKFRDRTAYRHLRRGAVLAISVLYLVQLARMLQLL